MLSFVTDCNVRLRGGEGAVIVKDKETGQQTCSNRIQLDNTFGNNSPVRQTFLLTSLSGSVNQGFGTGTDVRLRVHRDLDFVCHVRLQVF